MLLLIKYTLLYGIVLMLVALGGMFSEHSGIFSIACCKILFYKFYNYTGQKEYSNKVWNSHQTVEGFGNIP